MTDTPAPSTGAVAAPRPALSRILFSIPVIGWMLRELAADPARGFLPLVANLVLALALLTWLFGPAVIMVTVMAAAPLMLGLIMFISSDFVD